MEVRKPQQFILLFCSQRLVRNNNIAAYWGIKMQITVCIDIVVWRSQGDIGVGFSVVNEELQVLDIEIAQIYFNSNANVHTHRNRSGPDGLLRFRSRRIY